VVGGYALGALGSAVVVTVLLVAPSRGTLGPAVGSRSSGPC
jgi:hypothetical protein